MSSRLKAAAKKGMRNFSTGATRNLDTGKHDLDGAISPLFLDAFGTYMHFHRSLPDGTLRGSDNWQLGIPEEAYRKSLWRHFFDSWRALRGYTIGECLLWALLGIVFNVQGIIHERLKADPDLLARSLAEMVAHRDKQRATARRKR